jgi:hypothetical protein
MRTESTKNFKFGFVLTEADLRRIVGAMEDQLTKLPNATKVDTTFDIKYRNGALATTSSLDEVLSQENLGSAQIVFLKIKCSVGDAKNNSISMQFHNIELAPESDSSPIEFAVKGDERDWTFVTSSLLEERALKVRRPSLTRYIGVHTDWEYVVYTVAAMCGMLFFLYLSVARAPWFPPVSDDLVYVRPATSPTPKQASLSEEFEAALRAENTKDPIAALITREKLMEKRLREQNQRDRESREQQEKEFQIMIANRDRGERGFFLRGLGGGLLLTLIPPVLIYLFRTFLILYYPTYNFSWGDYVDVFRKKESIRKFVIVVIFIGVIVSFVGGVLANFTKIGR